MTVTYVSAAGNGVGACGRGPFAGPYAPQGRCCDDGAACVHIAQLRVRALGPELVRRWSSRPGCRYVIEQWLSTDRRRDGAVTRTALPTVNDVRAVRRIDGHRRRRALGLSTSAAGEDYRERGRSATTSDGARERRRVRVAGDGGGHALEVRRGGRAPAFAGGAAIRLCARGERGRQRDPGLARDGDVRRTPTATAVRYEPGGRQRVGPVRASTPSSGELFYIGSGEDFESDPEAATTLTVTRERRDADRGQATVDGHRHRRGRRRPSSRQDELYAFTLGGERGRQRDPGLARDGGCDGPRRRHGALRAGGRRRLGAVRARRFER